MKVLLTSNLNDNNAFIDGMYHRFAEVIEIDSSTSLFWDKNPKEDYNLIHIQWPEELFYWKSINNEDLMNLRYQLDFWKKRGCKILISRHNLLPHTLNDLYKKAYSIIFNCVDAVIHYSKVSIDNFKKMYPKEYSKNQQFHKVIFLPMYTEVTNNTTKSTARKYLNINENSKVVLVFGALRHAKEKQFALDVFNRLDIKHKLLMAPRWYNTSTSRINILKNIFSRVKFMLNSLNNTLYFEGVYIPENKIQYYLKSADVIFIPRFEVLNSGIPTLAFTFNKVVVGPSTGSIGEILSLANNPVFEIGNITDAVMKIYEGFNLSKEPVKNLEFAEKHMNWDEVIKKHLDLYTKILA